MITYNNNKDDNINKSDVQTNIDKYRITAQILLKNIVLKYEQNFDVYDMKLNCPRNHGNGKIISCNKRTFS